MLWGAFVDDPGVRLYTSEARHNMSTSEVACHPSNTVGSFDIELLDSRPSYQMLQYDPLKPGTFVLMASAG